MIPTPHRKIDKLVEGMRRYNIFPVFLEQLDCASIKKKHPLCAELEDALSEIREYLYAASKGEIRATYEEIMLHYRHQLPLEPLLTRRQDAVERAAFFLVITLTQQKYHNVGNYIRSDYRAKSEVLKVYPELGGHEDEEGLLPLATADVRPDRFGSCIYYKQHVLYYHQFLRRNFGSNPNYDFLAELAQYHHRHPGQRVAVAIDHLRLAPSKYAQFILEKDHSYGPPLKLESLDDPNALGLTVHRPNPNYWMHPELDRTEFYWSYRDGLKTLQIEEIYPEHPTSQPSSDYVLTRYVHSVRSIIDRRFTHLDGAIKVYPATAWETRYAQQLADVVKVSNKLKMFRVDGVIANNEWSRLISLFFQGNVMVPEYLNPDFETEG